MDRKEDVGHLFDRDRVLSVDWATYPILEIQDAPERIVKAARSLGDRIDVLVNNAGFMTFAEC